MTDDRHFDQRGQRVIGPQFNVAGDLITPALPPVFIPHIPAPPKDFTGRDEELQDLLAGFDRGATITCLRGMGGIGKTALAYALAEKLIDRYPNGQLLVELRGTDPQPMTPAEAMAKVIRAYHAEAKLPETESDLADIYRSVLHEMHVLLLLDNAADDKQVRPLLPPPTCGAIVTSRHKFTLPGLMAKDLNVLKTDKAAELLLKCWRPDASPTLEQLEDNNLLEIAQLCGFLPLALRAAGSMLANSPDLSPEEYRRDLKDERKRLEKIGKEGVDLDIGSSFGLSYTCLPPETAAVFRTLSIFPGDFDAKAEEFVCQDEDHKRLRELVRWSLVDFQRQSTGDQGRYHLHDLVRLFAAARLEEEDNDKARFNIHLRFAGHYKDVLSACDDLYMQGGAKVLVGLKQFDLDWPNIQVGQALAERAIHCAEKAKSRQTNLREYAEILNTYPEAGAFILELRLHPFERIHWLNKALLAARQLKHNTMEGVHLGNLGNAYGAIGEYGKAIKFYKKALAIDHNLGHRLYEGADIGNIGCSYAARGKWQKAISFHKKHLAIAAEIGDRQGEGAAKGNIGLAYAMLGEISKAIEYFEQHLAIAREIGDRKGEGNALGNIGLAYFNLGSIGKSIEFYEQRLAIAREIGDRREEGRVLGNIGLAFEKLGKPQEAVKFYKEALLHARDIADRQGEAQALWNLGLSLEKLGDRSEAEFYTKSALRIREELGDPRSKDMRFRLAEILFNFESELGAFSNWGDEITKSSKMENLVKMRCGEFSDIPIVKKSLAKNCNVKIVSGPKLKSTKSRKKSTKKYKR